MTPGVTVLIVDDQIVVRAGFHSVLRSQPGLKVVGLVSSGEAALTLLRRRPVNVLLLDLHMPGMSGIGTLQALQKYPCPPPTIILSSVEPAEEICLAVELGAAGYLRKDISCDEIMEAIRVVHAGGRYFPEWIATRISERESQSSLTARELEILEMVAKGLTNKEIGRAIQVSHFTVRNHVRHIMAKLNVGDRTEAATVALQQGMLSGHDSFPWDVGNQSLRQASGRGDLSVGHAGFVPSPRAAAAKSRAAFWPMARDSDEAPDLSFPGNKLRAGLNRRTPAIGCRA